jgi:hypothetical protein
MSKDKDDCPPVLEEVCKARMDTVGEKIKALDQKVTYIFGTSLVVIILGIATLAATLWRR